MWTANDTQVNNTYRDIAKGALSSAITEPQDYLTALPFFYIPTQQDIQAAFQPQKLWSNLSQVDPTDPFNAPCPDKPCTIETVCYIHIYTNSYVFYTNIYVAIY